MLIQNVFAYIAPPFAVIFTLGILWRRATATAATDDHRARLSLHAVPAVLRCSSTIMFRPYGNYLHRALISWAFCMIVMIAVSLLTDSAAAGEDGGHHLVAAVCAAAAEGAGDVRRLERFAHLVAAVRRRGAGDLRILLWFRFQHPETRE